MSPRTRRILRLSKKEYQLITRPYLIKSPRPAASVYLIFLSLFVFIGIPYLFVSFSVKALSSNDVVYYDATQTALLPYLVAVQLTARSDFIATSVPSSTPTMTPSPTISPSPSATSTPQLPILFYKLSFYDPMIGRYFPEIAEVNCLLWDYENKRCNSKVNNGLDDFSLWYRRGVACPPPLRDGQRLRILYPQELAAINEIWVCMDRGGAIVNDFLDFLLEYPVDVWTGSNLNNFPWASSVEVQLLP